MDKGIFASSGICLIYSVAAAAILILFGKLFAVLFVEPQATQLIDMIDQLLFWTSVFYFPLALVNIVRFTIQGLGFGKLAILAGVCEMIARSLVGFFAVPAYGYIAACLASPVAWILADAFLIPTYFGCVRYLRNHVLRKEANE